MNLILKKATIDEFVISILLPFLLLFTYIGRGVFNVTLSIILLLLIFKFIKKELYQVFSDKKLLFFSIFIISVAITVPFSDNIRLSLSKMFTFFFTSYIVIFSALYLYIYSENKKNNLIIALYIIFFTSVCMELITISSIYFNKNILVYIKTLGEVNSPIGNGFHLIEIFTAAIIPISLFLYYLKPSKLKLILILIAFIGILASTSRTAMIATLIPVTIFILIKNKFNIFSKETVYFILAVLIASFLAFELSDDIKKRVESFKTTFSLTNGDRMSGRYSVYEESFNRFKDSMIFGHGLKSATDNHIIIKHPTHDEIVKHPHNIWLELLLDTGLIGFVSFLVFVVYLLYSFLIQFKELSIIHIATIVSTLSSIFLSSLASWSIWSGNHIGTILFIMLLLYSLKYIKIKENKN